MKKVKRLCLNGWSVVLSEKNKETMKDLLFYLHQWVLYGFFVRWVKYLFFAKVLYLGCQQDKKLGKSLIIVGNHVSGWDPFLILSSLRKEFFFKHFVWRIPAHENHFKPLYKRIFFKLVGVYKIKGEGTLEKSLRSTLSVLDSGHSSVFFPEGKRMPPGQDGRPKKGIGYILKHRDTYVLPVHIDYSKRDKDKFGVKVGSKARVVFGKIYRSEYFREKYSDDNIHYGVMEKIFELRDALKPQSVSETKKTEKISSMTNGTEMYIKD